MMARKRQRSRGQGTLFRHTRADPIPDGWQVLEDVDGEHFKAGDWYAEGTKPHCGARRYRVNRTHDRVLVPVGPWIMRWHDQTGRRRNVAASGNAGSAAHPSADARKPLSELKQRETRRSDATLWANEADGARTRNLRIDSPML